MICGLTLYTDRFTTVFFLDKMVRQASDPQFGELLRRLRAGEVTESDCKLLMTRCVASTDKLSADCTMLLATNVAVDRLNRQRLRQLKSDANPVCVIQAHVHEQKQKASSVLRLIIGARVMLLRNLSVQHGLVNGSMGTLRSICYKAGARPPQLPDCVFVEFDLYAGPALLDAQGRRVVPIRPMGIDGATQLPLQLAWAITVHKSQGLTLKEVYLDFRSILRVSDGLVYTALTRVKRLQDLHVSWCSFPDLIKNTQSSKPLKNEIDRLRCLSVADQV